MFYFWVIFVIIIEPASMQLYLNVAIFIFGLLVGSFLNCVVYRLEKGMSFLKGRSFCPKCKHILSWQDLAPVFSYVFLKGRCRYCGKKISIQYPLVEIGTAVLFLLIFNFYFLIFNEFLFFNFYLISQIFLLFFLVCCLIIIFVYDLKHYIIPDKVLFPVVILVFIYRIFEFFTTNYKLQTINYFTAALLASGFFFALWLVSRGRWMGFGDVKLVFLLGLLLGWPHIFVGLFVAFLLGALVGLLLIILKKKGLKSKVPFGPFLVFGALVALLWGEQLWRWYFNVIT